MKRLLLVAVVLFVPASQAAGPGSRGVALVTAETQNQLIAVDVPSGRVLRRLRMPADPQNVEAYAGEAVVVSARASAMTFVRRIFVGYGAHHMAFSPNQHRLWIALGERARSISVVDTRNIARPKLVGHVDPRGLAHDLAFTPTVAMSG